VASEGFKFLVGKSPTLFCLKIVSLRIFSPRCIPSPGSASIPRRPFSLALTALTATIHNALSMFGGDLLAVSSTALHRYRTILVANLRSPSGSAPDFPKPCPLRDVPILHCNGGGVTDVELVGHPVCCSALRCNVGLVLWVPTCRDSFLLRQTCIPSPYRKQFADLGWIVAMLLYEYI